MSGNGIEVIVDERRFLELVAKETNTDILDYFNAIRAANLGIFQTQVKQFPVSIGQDIFQEDLIPVLPNSVFKFYVQISGFAAKMSIKQNIGNTTVAGQVFDGVALSPGIPKEFNIPVTRETKYNLFLDTAATIDLVRVVEFRLGQ